MLMDACALGLLIMLFLTPQGKAFTQSTLKNVTAFINKTEKPAAKAKAKPPVKTEQAIQSAPGMIEDPNE